MTTLKTLTIAAALVVGAASFAFAQNGPATGSQPPVAGGAGASNPSAGGGMGAAGGGKMSKGSAHKKSKKMQKPQ